MTSITEPSRALRHCRTCRRSFHPVRPTHAFCRPACRKRAHRLRNGRGDAQEPAQLLLGELHALQDAAGVERSSTHPYLELYARLQHAEQQSRLIRKRLAQLQRELGAMSEPALTVRVYHLAHAEAALPQVDLESSWVGTCARADGAVLVLGSVRKG